MPLAEAAGNKDLQLWESNPTKGTNYWGWDCLLFICLYLPYLILMKELYSH